MKGTKEGGKCLREAVRVLLFVLIPTENEHIKINIEEICPPRRPAEIR